MAAGTSTCAYLIVVAVWALYAASVHAFAGQARVLGPMLRADVPAFSRATLLVIWHVTTVVLLVLAGTILGAAFSHWAKPLLALALLHSLGFLVLFLWIGKRELGEPIRLPQWLLFGPLVIALGASFTSHPAAFASAGMLAVLAFAHFAWAANCNWPARDEGDLASYVVPENMGRQLKGGFPGRLATLAVAMALLALATVPVSIALGASWRWPARLIAAVFLVRGLFGLFYRPWSLSRSQQPYATYNRIFYSPGCLLIAAVVSIDAL